MSYPPDTAPVSHDSAAPTGDEADLHSHSIPRFDGRESRGHVRVPFWRLRLLGRWAWLRRRKTLGGAHTIVQFVGFPRSGHSLIGSLLDAHDSAVIAHELDAMGLFHKGLKPSHLMALMASNAEDFSRNGRWWNGYSYAVDTPASEPAPPIGVVGDKKGDWAARWSAGTPDLVERFAAATPRRTKWVLVTRHPLDNVATLSLRKGGQYDRLRIDPPPEGFKQGLAAAQESGKIARAASDAMIADYRALCVAVADMKQRVPAGDWHEIVYEDLVRAPRDGLAALAAFAGLDANPAWLDSAAALVHAGGSNSRDRVEWTPEQRAILAETISAHDFLHCYAEVG